MHDRPAPVGPGPVHRNAAIIIAMNLARDWPDVAADKVVGWWVFLLGSRPGAARRRDGRPAGARATQSEQRAARVSRALLTWCWL